MDRKGRTRRALSIGQGLQDIAMRLSGFAFKGYVMPARRQYKIVFVNGCFDILHVGHIKLLKFARCQGNRLIVGLNSDESIKRLKGPSRPINNERDRETILRALWCVDEVIVFDEDTPDILIRQLSPDLIVRGPDHTAKTIHGIEVLIYNCEKEISTTSIIEKLQCNP